MKKIFSILLAVMMIAAMSVTAFAAELPDKATDDAKSKDVTANYVAGESGGTVYKVDIEWGSMEFTYTAASEGTWDPETHSYDGATAASWTCVTDDDATTVDANEIRVTNHSNAAVTVSLAVTDVENDGVTVSCDDVLSLATADNGVNGAAGTATTASATVAVTGTLAESTQSVKIGTITLTLNDSNAG